MFCKEIFQQFKDVWTKELPNELPPKREVDHKIELALEVELSNKVPYKLNKKELNELKWQINEFLTRSYIKPS